LEIHKTGKTSKEEMSVQTRTDWGNCGALTELFGRSNCTGKGMVLVGRASWVSSRSGTTEVLQVSAELLGQLWKRWHMLQ